MVTAKFLENYRGKIDSGKLVTRDNAKNGARYGCRRLRHADVQQPDRTCLQLALVANPPKSYDELVAWAKENPKQFGYNGIKGGASGVSFVKGWIYAYGGDADKLMKGPFEEGEAKNWDKAFASLKDFYKERHHPRQCRHARHVEPWRKSRWDQYGWTCSIRGRRMDSFRRK